MTDTQARNSQGSTSENAQHQSHVPQLEPQELQQRYVELFDLAPVGYFIIDDSGFIVEANLAGGDLLATDRMALAGRAFSQYVAPNCRDTFYSYCTRLLDTDVRQVCELQLVRTDDTTFHAQLESTVLSGNRGGRNHMYITVTDISELKKVREEHARVVGLAQEARIAAATVEAISNGIILSALNGKVVSVNPACEEIIGYRNDELAGSSIEDVIRRTTRPEHLDEVMGVWHTVVGAAQCNRVEEHHLHQAILRARDGSDVPVEYSFAAIRADRTQVTGFAWSFSDITARQRLEKEILEISDREQERIGQDLHDGLGQHLTGIAWLTRTLEEQLAAKAIPEAQEAARIRSLVDDSIQQMRGLIRGLNLVGIDADGLVVALQKLAVSAEALLCVPCSFRCKGFSEIHEHAMALHLYRIAQEAVTNAIRHGQAGHVWIDLTEVDGKLTLAVRDDGVGIPEQSATQSGMGLQIMKYRASVIGASLNVERATKGGTVVTCSVQNRPNRLEGDDYSGSEDQDPPGG